MAQYQRAASQAPPDQTYPRLMVFLQFWKWLGPYLRNLIHKNAPYETYPTGKTGIFSIAAPPGDSPLRIAVAADWGTGTLEAETVGENIKAGVPHCTLHLGDVYYMGEKQEIDENCRGKQTKGYSGVYWPTGSLGSFALMGNHEMYSGGQGYFGEFLPILGLLNPDATVKAPQSASYFCLDVGHWIVLGLDTGYHSGGIPAFTAIPGVNSIPFFNVDARFDDKMLVWLDQTMKFLQPGGFPKKPVLVLTHHQPISSFEHAYLKPVKQLAQLGFLDGLEFVWLYGHEHRLTIYDKQTIAPSLTTFPRCIGIGGMPVEVTTLPQPDKRIRYYDPREHEIDNQDPGTKVGYNGHIVLLFEEISLKIEYHDIVNSNLLLTETFTPDGNGALECSFSKPADSPFISGS
jgi:hypothetical protein